MQPRANEVGAEAARARQGGKPLRGCSVLSPVRMRKLTRFFNVLDSNVNGYIEAVDFTRFVSVLAQLRGWQNSQPDKEKLQTATEKVWELLCKSADKNRDARVTLQEWLSWNESLPNGGSTNGAHPYLDLTTMLFGLLDTDNDGAITSREYGEFMRAYGVAREIDTNAVFATLDGNRDGKVTKQEAMQRFNEFWTSEERDAPGNRIFGPF
jgi:Ca2+-binding EF-hand superfamily protein